MAKLVRLLSGSNVSVTPVTRQDVIDQHKVNKDKGLDVRRPYQPLYEVDHNLMIDCVVCGSPMRYLTSPFVRIMVRMGGTILEKFKYHKSPSNELVTTVDRHFIEFPIWKVGRACETCLSSHEHKIMDEERVKQGDVKSIKGW